MESKIYPDVFLCVAKAKKTKNYIFLTCQDEISTGTYDFYFFKSRHSKKRKTALCKSILQALLSQKM